MRTALVQRHVPAGMQGRAFGNLYGAVGLAAGLSYVAGGVLLEAIGARAVLVLAGGGGLAGTAAVWLALPPALRRRGETPLDDEPDARHGRVPGD